MTSGMIALFFGCGVGGWAYSKLAHRTGNYSPTSTAVAATAGGALAALILFTVLKYIIHYS